MLVLHERKSRVTLAARLAGKTAAETISVMLAVFARLDPALRKSITFDNDTAFAQHALLRTMRAMTTWFCDAYASWQKGGVENANGRLRRWLPRQIDIDKVSDEEIQNIVMTANLTPRKCLGFKTPLQAILKELGKDVQIRFACCTWRQNRGLKAGSLQTCFWVFPSIASRDSVVASAEGGDATGIRRRPIHFFDLRRRSWRAADPQTAILLAQ